MRNILLFVVILLVVFGTAASGAAQETATPSPSPTPSKKPSRSLVRDIIDDQKTIWVTPFKMGHGEMKVVAPATLGLAALIATDRRTSGFVSHGGSLGPVSTRVSWGGNAIADIGVASAFFLVGRASHDARARETGRLIVETLVSSGIVVGVLKNTTQRLRPTKDGGSGEFFDGGQSFPSGHSASAWSVATVIALEYRDKPLLKYSAIAAATAVSAARYTGRNHFLSDIAVGSAIGIYTGRFVFKRRHDTSLDGKNAGDTTRLLPMLVPGYDQRSATYGVKAVWHL